MEVEYELTPEDMIAFQRYHLRFPPHAQQRGGPATTLTGVVVFLAVLTTALFFILSDNPAAEWWLMTVPFVGIGAALTLLGIIVYARLTVRQSLFRAMRQGRNAEKFLGWRRLSIDAEAVRNTSEFASSAYFWHGIDRVGTTRDHAFLYINTTTAVVVPRRAFRDDTAFEEFLEAARRYQQMARVADWEALGEIDRHERPRFPDVLPAGRPGGPPADEGITARTPPEAPREGDS